jgi:hypothetical protein
MRRIYPMVLAGSVAALVWTTPAIAGPVAIDCQSDDGKRGHAEVFYYSTGGNVFPTNGDLSPYSRDFQHYLEMKFGRPFPQAFCKLRDNDNDIFVYVEMRRLAGRKVVNIPSEYDQFARGGWSPKPWPSK